MTVTVNFNLEYMQGEGGPSSVFLEFLIVSGCYFILPRAKAEKNKHLHNLYKQIGFILLDFLSVIF